MSSNRATILIVEDDAAVVELISYTVKAGGWIPMVASNVADAWKIIKNLTPQLILLEWMLPGQCGMSLLSMIRAERRFSNLPVIMLTRKCMKEDKIAALCSGADDYVTKPFSPHGLTQRISGLLMRKLSVAAQ